MSVIASQYAYSAFTRQPKCTGVHRSADASDAYSPMPMAMRRIRVNAGFTVEAAAAELGIDQSQLSRIERGVSGTTTRRLHDMANLYGCQPSDLIANDNLAGRPLYTILVHGAVAAGVWQEAFDWPEEERYPIAVPVSSNYARFPKIGIEVRGPSMNIVYPEGTILICISTYDLQRPLVSGDRVIVQRHSKEGLVEGTVKELRIDADGKKWLWPLSTHPEFQTPIPLDSGDEASEIQATALVIGKYSDE